MNAAARIYEELVSRSVPPLLDFIPSLTPGYSPPLHLAPLVSVLEEMRTRPIRALSSVPPRFGKTETLVHGIVWMLRQHPERLIAYVSYGDSIVTTVSRRCRQLAASAGLRLSEESNSVHEWRTIQGGGLVAQSIQASLTGRGFAWLIYDDPVKNWEEAQSPVIRDKVFDEWQATALTRIEPGGSALVNATRWHHDDLIGRLERDARYKRINMPAVLRTEQGQEAALWPERWPLELLREQRASISERVWQALYMGQPSAESGNIFKREWFARRYSALPVLSTTIQAVDSAWKTGIGNDYSVISTWGATHDLRKYFLIDVWRARVQLPDLLQAIKAQAYKHRPRSILIEDAASGIAAIQVLKRETALPVIPTSTKNIPKELRAEVITPLFESERVWLPEGAEWLADWIEEHLRFPTDRHDDQVDTTSMALAYLSRETYQREKRSPLRRLMGSIYDV